MIKSRLIRKRAIRSIYKVTKFKTRFLREELIFFHGRKNSRLDNIPIIESLGRLHFPGNWWTRWIGARRIPIRRRTEYLCIGTEGVPATRLGIVRGIPRTCESRRRPGLVPLLISIFTATCTAAKEAIRKQLVRRRYRTNRPSSLTKLLRALRLLFLPSPAPPPTNKRRFFGAYPSD